MEIKHLKYKTLPELVEWTHENNFTGEFVECDWKNRSAAFYSIDNTQVQEPIPCSVTFKEGKLESIKGNFTKHTCFKIEEEGITEDTKFSKLIEVYQDTEEGGTDKIEYLGMSINNILNFGSRPDSTSLVFITEVSGEETVIWVKGLGLVDSEERSMEYSSIYDLYESEKKKQLNKVIYLLEEGGLTASYKQEGMFEVLNVSDGIEDIAFTVSGLSIYITDDYHIPLGLNREIFEHIFDSFSDVCESENKDDTSSIQKILNRLEDLKMLAAYDDNNGQLNVYSKGRKITWDIKGNGIFFKKAYVPLDLTGTTVKHILDEFNQLNTDLGHNLRKRLREIILDLEREHIYADVEKDKYLVCLYGEGKDEIVVSFLVSIQDFDDPMIYLIRKGKVYTSYLRDTDDIARVIKGEIVREYIK